jgi:HEAT repeat protein
VVENEDEEAKTTVGPPFDFAQGRIFGDDNKKSKGNGKNKYRGPSLRSGRRRKTDNNGSNNASDKGRPIFERCYHCWPSSMQGCGSSTGCDMKNGMSIRRLHLRSVMSGVLHAAVWCALLAGVGYGQASQDQVDESLSPQARSVMEHLKQGVYGPATQEQIAEAQAGQLVPMLEARFVTSQDAVVKGRVARALVDLGDKGNAYWDFLVQQAKLAIESDAPSSRCFSSTYCTGHAEYVAWARAHHAPEDSQAEMELHWRLEEGVGQVYGDPRGIPLLREALKSANINVVSTAADALTRAHDKDSIPLIVEACKRFHDPEEVRLIAHTLRQFQRDSETRPIAIAAEGQCLPPPDPLEALKRNDDLSRFYVWKAAAKHPAETVAILKENFVKTQDERHKAEIASALIGLGDKDDIYWDFLLRMETSLLEGEVSSAVKSDAQGKPTEWPSSDEAWAKQDREFNEMETFVNIVAETRDPRGIRLLRRALSSPDSETQNSAAYGLARAQDKDSIPLIIDVCKNAPPDVASVIAANALVYFDDPRAQSAVDQYLSKDAAKFSRAQKADRVGALGPSPPKK